MMETSLEVEDGRPVEFYSDKSVQFFQRLGCALRDIFLLWKKILFGFFELFKQGQRKQALSLCGFILLLYVWMSATEAFLMFCLPDRSQKMDMQSIGTFEMAVRAIFSLIAALFFIAIWRFLIHSTRTERVTFSSLWISPRQMAGALTVLFAALFSWAKNSIGPFLFGLGSLIFACAITRFVPTRFGADLQLVALNFTLVTFLYLTPRLAQMLLSLPRRLDRNDGVKKALEFAHRCDMQTAAVWLVGSAIILVPWILAGLLALKFEYTTALSDFLHEIDRPMVFVPKISWLHFFFVLVFLTFWAVMYAQATCVSTDFETSDQSA